MQFLASRLDILHLCDDRLKRAEFLRFIFQNSFESSVLFLHAVKLKDLLCLLYLFLNVVSAMPI